MHDQASLLRQRMRDAASGHTPGDAPPLIAIAGGKGGVGTTTLSVNLAVALALQGKRTLLVDADFDAADATRQCRLSPLHSIADVLSGHRTVHEALMRGPAGIHVLPGGWAVSGLADTPPSAQRRLMRELRGLGAHADVILLDVGSGRGQSASRFWTEADRVLLVTSGEPVSVMDSYAAIKVAWQRQRNLRVHTLVNFAANGAAAEDIHSRLEQTAERFLDLKLRSLGHLPFDPQIAAATHAGRLFRLAMSQAASATQLDRLASALLVEIAEPVVAAGSPLREALPMAA